MKMKEKMFSAARWEKCVCVCVCVCVCDIQRKLKDFALAGVAQWIECWTVN